MVCDRARTPYTQPAWIQSFSVHLLISLVAFPPLIHLGDFSHFAAFAVLLSSGLLTTMVAQYITLVRPLSPLPLAFRRKILLMWLPPFVSLWFFTLLGYAKLQGRIGDMQWSVIFVASYLFSFTLGVWMTIAKPILGLATVLLSVPFIFSEIIVGMYLDGVFGAQLPLFVPYAPVYLFIVSTAKWHQLLPYLSDGSFPILSSIWPIRSGRSGIASSAVHPQDLEAAALHSSREQAVERGNREEGLEPPEEIGSSAVEASNRSLAESKEKAVTYPLVGQQGA